MNGDYELVARRKGISGELAIQTSGEGPRTFLLANGFGTTSMVWDGLLPFFEARGRVVRFDWPVDPRHSVSVAYFLARHWKDSAVRLVPVNGHLPHLTHPELMRETLSELLDRPAGEPN